MTTTATAKVITLPTQGRPTETGTAYTVLAGTMTRYAGPDPDEAVRVLADLIEAEEEDVTVHATTNHVPDPEAARAVLDEATVDASVWPQCGLPELLAPAELREHVQSCRDCGRDD